MTDAEKIKQFIIQRASRHRKSRIVLEGKTPLFEKNLLDSFDVVELFTFLEETFGIEFKKGDLRAEHLGCLDSISELVRSRKPMRENPWPSASG